MERKFIISGGGTGGHIFPALSIADEIKRRDPSARILFVGALGRMEMERVPAAGYPIVGLPVEGIRRKFSFRNIIVGYKLIISLFKARNILKTFKPDIVIGVGGYASGPLLRMAGLMGIPTLIQEQNSYAGITNRLLAQKATRICVAYPEMDKYFPAEKIVLTGNPVREDLFKQDINPQQARSFFNIGNENPVLLVLGGSLGAQTINRSILNHLATLGSENIQVLWQTGKIYYNSIREKIDMLGHDNIKCLDFISRMDLAYCIAEVIISRAGAGTISELCLLGKPVVLVPSPNVAEDHQTKNAMALVRNNAALMVYDHEAPDKLVPEAITLMKNPELKTRLAGNCHKMGVRNSSSKIVDEINNILNAR
jgi:UDP-N-acetylglucosamine--N-acetylmuramyl-(pentapeptide) pyrophosphoryl-undecaprenol N-acetylglucosamine transferase